MATTVNETERKYEAPAGTALPHLDGLPAVAGTSGPEEEVLEAEYYDTDDLRLIRAGVTLRRRRGGSDQGWHLKLPLGGSTRREIQLPLGRGGRQVPAKLAALVRVYTRGAPLRPVARISTRRQRLTLMNDAGATLAEVAADEVSAQTLGEATALSQWNEVEVELTGGGSKLLKAADERLRRDGLARETAFHEARKSAKRARYAGEAVSPAIGKKAARFTKQMKKIQTVLGDHQDAVVARGVDRDLGVSAHLAGENAFTYGLLYEREDQQATQLQAEARQAWKHAAAPRFHRWAH
jgi:hypothetical protein